MFTSLLLVFGSSFASAASTALSTKPDDYAVCRYFYETDVMNCHMDAGPENTWVRGSRFADPAERLKAFKKEMSDKCWVLEKGNRMPKSILFIPFCLGD